MPTISQILQILAIAYAVFILALMLIALAAYQGLREIASAVRDSYASDNALRPEDMIQMYDSQLRRKE